jgi:hypothetical protein
MKKKHISKLFKLGKENQNRKKGKQKTKNGEME